MEMERKIKILQGMYAGVLADSVLRMGRAGILEEVTKEKRLEQMQSGSIRAAQMGIDKPQAVFEVLSDLFNCADWTIEEDETSFTATATRCMLCAMAKKIGAPSPCRIYCLDPMEAMIKGVDSNAEFMANKTLWEGQKCSVGVTQLK